MAGAPVQSIKTATIDSSTYGVIADEYNGIKPKLSVKIGDSVARGQELFVAKEYPSIRFLSPCAGIVTALHRGQRRVLQSIVIEAQSNASESFDLPDINQKPGTPEVSAALQRAGLWQSFKTRPYSNIPEPTARPHSIFVNAIDTRPLCADPQVVIADSKDYFIGGLRVITALADCPIYLCVARGADIPTPDSERIKRAEFHGGHPAGLSGTHIHLIDPVNTDKTVWSINYQDVIMIGEWFATGQYPVSKVIALAGPSIKHPRLLRTQLGAPIRELSKGQINGDSVRLINGSVLDGVRIESDLSHAYVSRFQNQITALPETAPTKKFAWLRPGIGVFSITRTFLPQWMKKPAFTCMQNGSERAVIPIGVYERVLPFDMLATPLLKSLLVMDIEMAQKLGCLELDEEDLALCTYVCPSKYEFGVALRQNLNRILREG